MSGDLSLYNLDAGKSLFKRSRKLPSDGKDPSDHCLCVVDHIHSVEDAHCNCLRHCPCDPGACKTLLVRPTRLELCVAAVKVAPMFSVAYLDISKFGSYTQMRLPDEVRAFLSSKRPDFLAKSRVKWNTMSRREIVLLGLSMNYLYADDKSPECERIGELYNKVVHSSDGIWDQSGLITLLDGSRIDKQSMLLRIISSKSKDQSGDGGDESPRQQSLLAAAKTNRVLYDFASCLQKLSTRNGPSRWITPEIIEDSSSLLSDYTTSDVANREVLKSQTLDKSREWLAKLYAGDPSVSLHDIVDHPGQPGDSRESIYASLAMQDLDGIDEYSLPDEQIKEHWQRNPEACAPYLSDARRKLEAYRDAVNESCHNRKKGIDDLSPPFDFVYFFACSRLERKLGNFTVADQLMSAYKYLKCDLNLFSLRGAILSKAYQKEEDLRDILRPSSNQNAARPQSPVRSSHPRDAPVYNTCQERWEEEYRKELSEEDKQKYSVMDEIMRYEGLESVKEYLLSLFEKVIYHNDRGEGETFNFQILGNPGTGKTTFGRLMCKLLIQLGIRPGPDAAIEKKRTKLADEAQEADLKAQTDKLQEQQLEMDAIIARRNYMFLESRLAKLQEWANRMSSISQSANAVANNAGSSQVLRQAGDSTRQNSDQVKAEIQLLLGDVAKAKKVCEDEESNLKTAKQTAVQAQATAAAAAQAVPTKQPDRFVETTGSKPDTGELARNGADALKTIVEGMLALNPPGGIIFIDEAGHLTKTNQKGLDIVHYLLTAAENHRDKITFMLTGYPSQFKDLMKMDAGFASRFPRVVRFEDYNEQQLSQIFRRQIEDMAKKTGKPWKLENDCMANVMGRRLYRSAGQEGFSNARECRNYLEVVKERYYRRVGRGGDFIIHNRDVLGERPNLETSQAYKRISKLIGQSRIKERVAELIGLLKDVWDADNVDETEDSERPKVTIPILNRAFVGNPGVGKTTIGKLYASLLKDTGFLSKGEVIETTPSDFTGINANDTILKTKAIMASAKGNVLLIDEAYNLNQDAIGEIVAMAPAQAGADMAIIICGYAEEIDELLRKSNPGLKRRFPEYWEFSSYDEEELRQIFLFMAKERHVVLPYEVAKEASKFLALESKLRTFGNAGAVDNLLSSMESKARARVTLEKWIFKTHTMHDFKPLLAINSQADQGNSASRIHREAKEFQSRLEVMSSPLAQQRLLSEVTRSTRSEFAWNAASSSISNKMLNTTDFLEATYEADDPATNFPLPKTLVEEINRITAAYRFSINRRKPPPDIRHMLFVGSPGTGKTFAAKRMAKIFKKFGILPKSTVIERNADDIVAGFVGQTADLVKKLLEDAEGGVLFIDEAHRLSRAHSGGAGAFKDEAIGVLMKALEPNSQYHNKLLIIFAGYEAQMDELLREDPGLNRRFGSRVRFDPITAEAAYEMFMKRLPTLQFSLGEGGESAIKSLFEDLVMRDAWSSVADVETVFRELGNAFAMRVERPGIEASNRNPPTSPEELQRLAEMAQATPQVYLVEDIDAVAQSIKSRRRLLSEINPPDAHQPASVNDFLERLRQDYPLAQGTASRQQKKTPPPPPPGANAAAATAADVDDEVREEEQDEPDEQEVAGNSDSPSGDPTIELIRQLDEMGLLANHKKGLDTEAARERLADDILKHTKGKVFTDKLLGPGQPASIQSIAAGLAKLRYRMEQDFKRHEDEMRAQQAALEAVERQLEDSRLLAAAQDDEAEKKRQEELRKKLEELKRQEAERIQKANAIKEKFRAKCPAGFDWHKVSGGWQCDGGSHYIYDHEV